MYRPSAGDLLGPRRLSILKRDALCKLKVLQIVTRLVDRGVPRHVLDLASGLVGEGYDVDVLAGRSEPGEHDLWGEARRRGLDTHYVGHLQRSVGPTAVAADFAILRLVRAGGYHVVHTHISMAGFLGRLVAHQTGVPAVVHTNMIKSA